MPPGFRESLRPLDPAARNEPQPEPRTDSRVLSRRAHGILHVRVRRQQPRRPVHLVRRLRRVRHATRTRAPAFLKRAPSPSGISLPAACCLLPAATHRSIVGCRCRYLPLNAATETAFGTGVTSHTQSGCIEDASTLAACSSGTCVPAPTTSPTTHKAATQFGRWQVPCQLLVVRLREFVHGCQRLHHVPEQLPAPVGSSGRHGLVRDRVRRGRCDPRLLRGGRRLQAVEWRGVLRDRLRHHAAPSESRARNLLIPHAQPADQETDTSRTSPQVSHDHGCPVHHLHGHHSLQEQDRGGLHRLPHDLRQHVLLRQRRKLRVGQRGLSARRHLLVHS